MKLGEKKERRGKKERKGETKYVRTCTSGRELEKEKEKKTYPGKSPTPGRRPADTEEELWGIGGEHRILYKAVKMEIVLYKWSLSPPCTSQP